MGTYAVWKLWVGIKNSDIVDTAQSARADEIFRELEKGETFPYRGLDIADIAMHGESVGIGVEAYRLSWTTEIGDKNVFSREKFGYAKRIVPLVREAFRSVGIKGTVRIYHHVDLGG